MIGWLFIVGGVAWTAWTVFQNASADKVLGWYQFVRWPLIGVALMVVGIVCLLLEFNNVSH